MVLLIISTFIFYIINFFELDISKNPNDWGPFGDYFGGILNPIIGIANIIILLLISYQIASWDNKRHRNEFLYKAYCNLSEKLDNYKINSLTSSQLKELSEYLLAFKINQQFLFEGRANIIFNERLIRLESTTFLLKKILEEEEVVKKNSDTVDVSDLVTELTPYLIKNAIETELTKKSKEFEIQKQYLIGFFQRILNNSNFECYAESEIIKNDGKYRRIAS